MAVQADYNSIAQQVYISYFGRPADAVGLNNMTISLRDANVPVTGVAATDITAFVNAYSTDATIKGIIDNFGTSDESTALYGAGASATFVDAIFTQVLGRSPALEGLLFWTNALDSGRMTRGETALRIMEGALNNTTAPGLVDAAAVANKVTAAQTFTDNQLTTADLVGYVGSAAAATARTWLSTVTDDAATLTAATSTVATTITAINTATSTVTTTGTTYTLTTSADTGAAFTGTSANDTFVGTLASPGETNDSSTLTAGDALDGGLGVDTLNVTVGGAAIAATTSAPILTSIEKVLVSNQEADAADNVTFDLTSATGLTHLGTTSSVANGDTTFTNVGSAVALQMAGSGDLTVKFSDTVVSGTTDSVTVTLNGVKSAALLTLDNQTGSAGAFETVNLVSSTSANSVTLTDVDAKTVAVSGDQTLTLAIAGSTAVTAVNASTLTAALTLTGDAAVAVSIVGGTANDVLTIGNFGSTDTIDGGTGTDTLNVDNTITASTDLANVSNVEILATTGAINVTLAADIAGLTTIDTTTGGDANTVTFASGYTAATTVKADAGDIIDNSGANAAISVNFSSDDAVTVTGGTGTDTLNITASTSAVTFDSKITVVDTVTIVDYGSDAAGGSKPAGEDVTLTLGTYATALTIDASALDAGTLDADGAMEANWENLTVTGASATKALNITGGTGADTITGGTANDVINGGAGNDSINGSAGGADSISGGAGNDTIDMAGALTSADTIDGGDGTDILAVTSLSTSGLTNVTNVETLSLSGSASSATLSANLSFTSIDMRTVDDLAQTLTMASGYTNATTVLVDAGDKVVNTANVAMSVTANAADLQSGDLTTITGGTGTDTLTVKADSTTANIVATSGLITLVDVITVTDGGDVTSGTVTAGKDITIDLASYATATTALTIDASALDGGTVVSGTMTNDEVLTITGTSARALNVTGGGGADVIIGSSSASGDSLTGGAGNDTFTMSTNLTYQDTIAGGDGTDTITTGAITDVAFMRVTGIETVTLASTATLGTYFDASGATKVNLHIAAAAVDASTTSTGHNFVAKASGGGAVNNDITGGMGNDTFTFGDGGSTADDLDTSEVIAGGAGTDTVAISNALASVVAVLDLNDVTAVETIQLGTASGLASSSTETIALTVEAIALTTAQTITIDASVITDADDTVAITNSAGTTTHATKFSITGGAGADTLAGSYLADTIAGGAGNDSITGNLGADVLTGGEGADTFVYAATNAGTNDSKSTAADTVADFVSGTDQLVLAINGGGAASGNVEYLGEFASNIDALASMSSKVGEYFFNTTTNQLVMDIDGNGLIQADDLAITMTGATKINAGDAAISLTNVTAQTIVATTGDDTFNFIQVDLAGATLDGLAGTDTINVTVADTSIVDADFLNFDNMEVLKLTGISSAVVGTNADAAGLATGHGTIVTGAGATQITADNSKHFTINAAAIVDGTALTLLDGGTSNFVVTGLIGDIVTTTLAGTLSVTTASVATVSIDAASGNTTVAGTATAVAIAAGDLTGGNATLTLSGTSNYTVTGLASTGAFISTATGTVDVTGGAGIQTITTGAGAATITGGAAVDVITLGAANGAADKIITGSLAADADSITNFEAGAGGDVLDLSAALTAVTLTIGAQIDAAGAANQGAGAALITAAAGADAEVYYILNTAGSTGVQTIAQIETAITAAGVATGQVTVIIENATGTYIYTDQAAQTDSGGGTGMILQASLIGVSLVTTGDLISE